MKFLKIFTLFIVILGFVFVLNPKTTQAKDCCAFLKDSSQNIKAIYKCTKNYEKTGEQCGYVGDPKKTIFKSTIQGSSIWDHIHYLIIDDCDKQCSSVNAIKKSFYHQTWCCVETSGLSGFFQNKISQCTKIPIGEKCHRGELFQQSCTTISTRSNACTQVKLYVAPPKQAIADQRKALEQQVISGLTAGQVKPSLSTPLPGLPEGTYAFENIALTQPDASGTRFIIIPWLAQYIKWIYTYAIGIAGIVATVMVMVGGILWITSAGDAGKVSQAKDYIKSAVLGLILVMAAYLIANFVNPALVQPAALKIEVPQVKEDPNRDVSVHLKCDYKKLNTTGERTTVQQVDYCKNQSEWVDLANGLSGIIGLQKFVSAPGVKVHPDVLKKIVNITKFGQVSHFSQVTDQVRILSGGVSLNSQQELCDKYQKCLVINKNDASKCSKESDPPKCQGNNQVTGKAFSATLIGSGRYCGQFYNNANCRTKSNNNSAANKQTNCTPQITSCQNALYDALTPEFKSDPDRWWYFKL